MPIVMIVSQFQGAKASVVLKQKILAHILCTPLFQILDPPLQLVDYSSLQKV